MKCLNFRRLGQFFLLSYVWGLGAPLAGALELPKPQGARAVVLMVTDKSRPAHAPIILHLDAAMLDGLPQKSFTTKTPWFKDTVKFSGPLLKDVLQAIKVSGTRLNATALNDYKIDIPVADALKYGAILARRMDDRILTVRDKGPLWLMYPFDTYPELKNLTTYSRCIWQLQTITVE
jgi:hypothetical protein